MLIASLGVLLPTSAVKPAVVNASKPVNFAIHRTVKNALAEKSKYQKWQASVEPVLFKLLDTATQQIISSC